MDLPDEAVMPGLLHGPRHHLKEGDRMCVTAFAASLGRTAIAGWRNTHQRTHCLLYGNEPVNLAGVPNAMILHIPVAPNTTLTRDNFLPTEGLQYLLADMWAAVPKPEERLARGMTSGASSREPEVNVFTMGSYTWVVAARADAGLISDALGLVQADRRPRIGEPLTDFYLRTWPEDALAIGCFSSASGKPAEPACIEYVPRDWDVLRMPATDAHGHVPDLGELVTVNHRLVVGTGEFGLGGHVAYRERHWMEPRLRDILPQRVVGAEVAGGKLPNGDFYVDFGYLTQGPGGCGAILRAHGAELGGEATRIPVLMS
jgi:hypothetical protein